MSEEEKQKYASLSEIQIDSYNDLVSQVLLEFEASYTKNKNKSSNKSLEQTLGNKKDEKNEQIINIKITYKQQEIMNLKDLILSESDFFPHVIGSKYDSWEQYQNNMFFLLKEVNFKLS